MQDFKLQALFYFVGVFSGWISYFLLTKRKKSDTIIGKIKNWVE